MKKPKLAEAPTSGELSERASLPGALAKLFIQENACCAIVLVGASAIQGFPANFRSHTARINENTRRP